MNEYNQEQIATEIAELLNSDRFLDALIGKTSGAQSGGSLVVSSNGRQINAIAVGEVPPGDCVALKDTNTGQWYAVSSYDQGKNNEYLIRYRRWRQPEDSVVYPVATLFSIINFDQYKIAFYVGGNQTSRKIYEITDYGQYQRSNSTTGIVDNSGENKISAYIQLYKNLNHNNYPPQYRYLYVNKIGQQDIFQYTDMETIMDIPNSPNWYGGRMVYLGNQFEAEVKIKADVEDGVPITRHILKKNDLIPVTYEVTDVRIIKTPDNAHVLLAERDLKIETLMRDGSLSEVTLTGSHDITFHEQQSVRVVEYVENYIMSNYFSAPTLTGAIGESPGIGFDGDVEHDEQRVELVEYLGNYNAKITETVSTIKWRNQGYDIFYVTPGVTPPPGSSKDMNWDYPHPDLWICLPPVNPYDAIYTRNVITIHINNPFGTAGGIFGYNERLPYSSNLTVNGFHDPNNAVNWWLSFAQNWSLDSCKKGYITSVEAKRRDRRTITYYGTGIIFGNWQYTETTETSINWEGAEKIGYTGIDSYSHIKPANWAGHFENNQYIKNFRSITFDPKTFYVPLRTRIRDTVEGIAVISFTSDGEIVQDYRGYIEYRNDGSIQINDQSERYVQKKGITVYPVEERNIIKLKYGNLVEPTEITLNTSDFGIIDTSPAGQYIFYYTKTITPIDADSTSFSITINYPKFYLIKNFTNRGGLNISAFSSNYIFSTLINNKPAIIKGEITSATFNPDTNTVQINCSITSVKTNTPSSFLHRFIVDNGSYYAYFFRNSSPLYSIPYCRNDAYFWQDRKEIKEAWYPYGSNFYQDSYLYNSIILNKSVIPLLCLTPSHISLFSSNTGDVRFWEVGAASNSPKVDGVRSNFLGGISGTINNRNLRNLNNETIVRNKIYCVVKTEGSKAWIEQWDIKNNGDVKYNKVFQVDYVPLKKPKTDEGEAIAILAHSYYPK